jgi:2-polyprenyl-6-hydroxyphenyl methylase/3-demethylubiquinone-9 3-methyltransferase
LGARVYSFDYDPQSVATTHELRRRYFPEDADWTIEEGSVLDEGYVTSLGRFDVVYSWGVLHHTGAMWRGLENAALPVAEGGRLFVAIYNDQGAMSHFWRKVKKLYVSGPLGKMLISAVFIPYFVLGLLSVDLFRRKNPLDRYRQYKKSRGMSMVHDWRDWLGGYPFEVAKPEEILQFYRNRGFVLDKLLSGTSGNNEFVFTKRSAMET